MGFEMKPPNTHSGVIVWFDAKQGCGTLRDDDGNELFIRQQERSDTFGLSPVAGQRISFRSEFCDRLGRHLADDWEFDRRDGFKT